MDDLVTVMMSSYNGERYIKEMTDSILNQSHRNIKLVIRDDGSTDSTLDILDGYPMITVIKEKNIGLVRSFLKLLEISGDSAYYAFADQDDVWRRNKLKYAVEKLKEVPKEIPAAYFCRLEIVSENLRHMAYTPLYNKPLTIKTAICGNVLTGMACVFNKAARDLVVSAPPDFTVMHDWWVYIVVAAFGKIIYDERPMVMYRQHGANDIGIKVTLFGFIKFRLKKYLGGKYHKKISLQAAEFYRLFGHILSEDDKCFIQGFIKEKNFFERIAYAVLCPAYRQRFIDNVLLRALIITNQL